MRGASAAGSTSGATGGASARILIASQAPGRKVHASGLPFTDASGDRLRDWLGMPPEVFYDASQVAIAPMGFCYPGTGRSGDLPPRPECAPQWRAPLLQALPHVQLTLVIGQYALDYHLPTARTLTHAGGAGVAQPLACRGAFAAPQPAQQPLAAQ